MIPNGPGGCLADGQFRSGRAGVPAARVRGGAEFAGQRGRDRLDAGAMRVLGA